MDDITKQQIIIFEEEEISLSKYFYAHNSISNVATRTSFKQAN